MTCQLLVLWLWVGLTLGAGGTFLWLAHHRPERPLLTVACFIVFACSLCAVLPMLLASLFSGCLP